MQFIPKTEEELEKEAAYLKIGEATFQVIKAIDATSSKGDDMIALEMKVWDEEGKEGILKDWLPSTFPRKLYQFCKSINRTEYYHSGNLSSATLLNTTGKCMLHLKKNKEGNTFVNVHYYINHGESKQPQQVIAPAPPADFSEDVPF